MFLLLLYSKKYKIFVEFVKIYAIFILSKIHPQAKARGFLFDEYIVKYLNENGFYTLYSCQGEEDNPYIMIQIPRTKKRINEFIEIVRNFYPNFYLLSLQYSLYNHALAIYMHKNKQYKGLKAIMKPLNQEIKKKKNMF